MTIKQTSFCTFALDFKNGSVLVNPVKKSETDIVIYSNSKSGYLNYQDIQNSLEVKNAGEFEIKDIFIDAAKNTREENLIFTISADEINVGVIAFCEDVNNIPTDIFESTDVLLIGAGSGPFLSPEKAYALANRIAPSVAIYFGFKEQANKDVEGILDSTEEVKKVISALQLSEKSLKIDKDFVDGLENTVHYYFEM